jgi:hypothetical protein
MNHIILIILNILVNTDLRKRRINKPEADFIMYGDESGTAQMPDTISVTLRDAFGMFSCLQQCYLFILRYFVKALRCGKHYPYDALVYSMFTCVLATPQETQYFSCLWYITSLYKPRVGDRGKVNNNESQQPRSVSIRKPVFC